MYTIEVFTKYGKSSEAVEQSVAAMANELQGQHEWREWFALPFLISPASSAGGYGHIDR